MPRKASLLALVALFTALLAVPSAHAARLGDARKSAHGTSTSRSSSSSRSSGHHGGYYGGPHGYYPGYGYNAWWGLRVFGAPWWGPYAATGDSYDRPYAFPGAPYADGVDGYVRIAGVTPSLADPGASAHPGRQFLGNSTAVRLSTEGSYIDADLQRYSVAVLLSTHHRFEIGTEWHIFRERLPAGEINPSGGSSIDTLVMGTVDGTLLFAQGPHSQFRTGLGVRTLLDSVNGDAYGINFLYAMDFYPARPLVVSMRGDIGTVGQAAIARARATVGFMISHLEVYGGFDKTWMTDANLGGGPVLGVRLWN